MWHELRTPITFQRALVEVALADPHADTAALRAMGDVVLASCDEQHRLIGRSSISPAASAGSRVTSRSTSQRSRPTRFELTT
jgi:hypothetical protein